jgi:hypothetical protein
MAAWNLPAEMVSWITQLASAGRRRLEASPSLNQHT